jgi:hypothetical protein
MSRGHGKMELYVLATLTYWQECSPAVIASLHPKAERRLPSRSVRSSINRALHKLEMAGKIQRIEHEGFLGWRLDEEPGERMRTAYHEAGHAVVGRLLSIPIIYVTIKPSENSVGHVRHAPLNQNFEHDVLFSVAGEISEKILLPETLEEKMWRRKQRRIGARSDHKEAKTAASNLIGTITHDGQWRIVHKDERRRAILKLRRKAEQLVLKNKLAIERVASALIEEETLSGQRLDDIIKGKT